MTTPFSTPVKYITSIALTVLLTVGTMFAIDITTTTQTAAPGDKITSTWVNAVNTASVSAASPGHFCVTITNIVDCKSTMQLYGVPSSYFEADIMQAGGAMFASLQCMNGQFRSEYGTYSYPASFCYGAR